MFIASSCLNHGGISLEELLWIFAFVILVHWLWLEVLRPRDPSKFGGECHASSSGLCRVCCLYSGWRVTLMIISSSLTPWRRLTVFFPCWVVLMKVDVFSGVS